MNAEKPKKMKRRTKLTIALGAVSAVTLGGMYSLVSQQGLASQTSTQDQSTAGQSNQGVAPAPQNVSPQNQGIAPNNSNQQQISPSQGNIPAPSRPSITHTRSRGS